MPRESSSGPPPPNPVLTAYESYLRDTPLITRYVLNATVISYFTGFFFSPAFLLANIPMFTIFKFQLYRIVTSPLICTDILSLFFTFMGFMNHGVRLEQSMGSSLFAALFFTLTIVANTLFLIISILLWGLTSNSNYLMAPSIGIWTVLLGIIAVECSEAPPDTKRRLFFIEVPALYYPLVLLALFSMFAGVKIPYFLGVAVGYAYGHGKLDRWKVKVETVSMGCIRSKSEQYNAFQNQKHH
jgi:membrane associated rhomboid family serine protease